MSPWQCGAANPTIKELIDQLIRAYTWEGHPYIAEDYGYIILIEEGDTTRIAGA